MRTLSIIAYAIGSILLIASCFTTGFTVTWCEGGAAVAFLVIGCVLQFNAKTPLWRADARHKPPRQVDRIRQFNDF